MGEYWYYKIQLAADAFTPGTERVNMALTRRLLRNIDINGTRCIDIGTQEGVVPVLLERAGARHVTAYDRINAQGKIDLVKQLYSASFDYICGIQLAELPRTLDARGGRYFDVVVFSGVLYHMINPMGLLALVRGLCSLGGFFVMETAAVNDPEAKLIFNAEGKSYGPHSNYFMPTVGWLEYVLRMLGLRPLQAVYREGKRELIRLALLCRSEERPCPANKDDSWINEHFHANIFRNEADFDWDKLAASKKRFAKPRTEEDIISLENGNLFDNLANAETYRHEQSETLLAFDSKM